MNWDWDKLQEKRQRQNWGNSNNNSNNNNNNNKNDEEPPFGSGSGNGGGKGPDYEKFSDAFKRLPIFPRPPAARSSGSLSRSSPYGCFPASISSIPMKRALSCASANTTARSEPARITRCPFP